MSEEFTKVIAAIHLVQQEAPVISRGETADTGKFKYKYASMARVWDEVKPLLAKHKLTVMQPPSFDISDRLQTWLFHDSGQWVKSDMRLIIVRDDPQGMGAAITYARRYALLSILGLITDDDTDASSQRLADGDMKREWVRAYTVMARKIDPEKTVTNNDFIKFMTEVYGKHPTKVLAREHQQVLDTINAFSPDAVQLSQT